MAILAERKIARKTILTYNSKAGYIGVRQHNIDRFDVKPDSEIDHVNMVREALSSRARCGDSEAAEGRMAWFCLRATSLVVYWY